MTGILHGLIGSLVPESSIPIEYIGYKTLSDSGGSWSVSFTGLGIQNGDMVVLAIGGDEGNISITTSGYTLVADNLSDPEAAIYYKIMGSTPDSSVSGNNAESSLGGTSGIISVFRNVGSIGEFAETNGPSGDPDPPSITTTVNGCMILACGMVDDDNVTSFTVPDGFTTIGSSTYSGEGDSSTLAAYYLQQTAGTIDPTVMTNSGDDTWWAATVALRPL